MLASRTKGTGGGAGESASGGIAPARPALFSPGAGEGVGEMGSCTVGFQQQSGAQAEIPH